MILIFGLIHLTKELCSKRMRKKNPPNGNIIVNSKGKYNKYDMKVHRDKFNEIKRFYIIGDPDKSHLLTGYEIKTLNPDFMEIWKY